jgi:quinol monooxygenase YgiN
MNGIFLVSLNSRKLDHFLKSGQNLTIDQTLDKLDLFVFDGYETLNGIFFNEKNVKEQDEIVEQTIANVISKVVDTYEDKRRFLRLSNMQKELAPYTCAVYNEYYSNVSFKRHCKSQIFQNLQPKLRDVNILNHKSKLVELIAPFLLVEIALYLFVFHTGRYQKIFGLESEMNIIIDIKDGKYPAFASFVNNKTLYEKVILEPCLI